MKDIEIKIGDISHQNLNNLFKKFTTLVFPELSQIPAMQHIDAQREFSVLKYFFRKVSETIKKNCSPGFDLQSGTSKTLIKFCSKRLTNILASTDYLASTCFFEIFEYQNFLLGKSKRKNSQQKLAEILANAAHNRLVTRESRGTQFGVDVYADLQKKEVYIQEKTRILNEENSRLENEKNIYLKQAQNLNKKFEFFQKAYARVLGDYENTKEALGRVVERVLFFYKNEKFVEGAKLRELLIINEKIKYPKLEELIEALDIESEEYDHEPTLPSVQNSESLKTFSGGMSSLEVPGNGYFLKETADSRALIGGERDEAYYEDPKFFLERKDIYENATAANYFNGTKFFNLAKDTFQNMIKQKQKLIFKKSDSLGDLGGRMEEYVKLRETKKDFLWKEVACDCLDLREYTESGTQTAVSFVDVKYDGFMVEQTEMEEIYKRQKFDKKLDQFAMVSNLMGGIRDLKMRALVETIYQMRGKQHDLVKVLAKSHKTKNAGWAGLGNIVTEAEKLKTTVLDRKLFLRQAFASFL